MTYVDYIWQHQWISGEIVPCFLVRQLSVQQKLSISEDNLKIRNDLKNKEHIKKKIMPIIILIKYCVAS